MIGGGSRCLGGGVWATGKRERIKAEPGGANEKQEGIQSDRAPAWSSWPRRSGAQSGVHSVTAGAVEPPYGRQDTSCHLTSISYSMRLYKNIIQNTCDTRTDFLSFREYGWQDPTTKLQGHFTAHMVQREVSFNVKCQFEQIQTVIFGKHKTTSDYCYYQIAPIQKDRWKDRQTHLSTNKHTY